MNDLRKYASQTNSRLLVGFIVILFLIGDGLIYAIYGREAAFMGLICLVFGLAPLLLICWVLLVVEWFVKRQDN